MDRIYVLKVTMVGLGTRETIVAQFTADVDKLVSQMQEAHDIQMKSDPVWALLQTMHAMAKVNPELTMGRPLPQVPVLKIQVVNNIGIKLGDEHSVFTWLANDNIIPMAELKQSTYIQLMQAFERRVDQLLEQSDLTSDQIVQMGIDELKRRASIFN